MKYTKDQYTFDVTVGNEIKRSVADGPGLSVDDIFWMSFDSMVSSEGARVVRVVFSGTLPTVSSLESISGKKELVKSVDVHELVCVEGDAVGYGWSMKLGTGHFTAWLDENQIVFVCPSDDQHAIWSLISDALYSALGNDDN